VVASLNARSGTEVGYNYALLFPIEFDIVNLCSIYSCPLCLACFLYRAYGTTYFAWKSIKLTAALAEMPDYTDDQRLAVWTETPLSAHCLR